MYRIVDKKVLNPTVVQLQIEAPLVANKARPGQFIILRVDENGERIPLTVAGYDREAGTVVCQNSKLANEPNICTSMFTIREKYLNNSSQQI